MRNRSRNHTAICLAVVGMFSLYFGTGNVAAQKEGGPGKEGVGTRGQAFIDAFNRGDAKAVAMFWTQDGEYVDQEGRQFKGREALQNLFQKAFTEEKGSKLKVTVISKRQLGQDVVIEDGITEVTPADGGAPSVARFMAVLVKQDGEWYFESVRDSLAQPPSNVEHFEELEWLIGDWTGDKTKGESMEASYDWAENKNFIVCSFVTTLNGEPVVGGTQWISWDAVDKQIRSHSFYSGGGVGEAVWTREGNKWMSKLKARTADGKVVSATNILTRIDADHATFQVTQLTVDGKTLPDAPATKISRVKEEEAK